MHFVPDICSEDSIRSPVLSIKKAYMKNRTNVPADALVFEEFYQQNNKISLYFFIVVLLLTLWGGVMEYLRSNWVLFYLDWITVFFCCVEIVILRFYSGVSVFKRFLVIGILLLIMFIETETQFHDNHSNFYEVEMWLTNPIVLILIALFFNAKSIYYFLFSFSVFAYFMLRIALEGTEHFNTRAIWILIGDMSAIQLFIYFFHVWLYGYRIETIRNTEKLNKQILQERESVTRNLHDYLGAKATDLSLLVKSIQNHQMQDMESLEKLKRLSEEIFNGIREITANMEDAKLISEDLWSGIRVLLLRRYGDGGRKVKFSRSGDSDFCLDSNDAEQLLGIITEICSNDLKYGSGISHWNFHPHMDKLIISIRCVSNFQRQRSGSMGHKTIRERAAAIKADWLETLEKKSFQGKLEIPADQFRRI